MGYSEDESMVRVDFFKPTGKWYTTEAVKWTGEYKDCCIFQSFRKSLRDHFEGSNRLSDMDAICLEPYHIHAHPIILKNGSWKYE